MPSQPCGSGERGDCEKGVEVEGDLATVDALYLTGDEDLLLGCARRTFPFTRLWRRRDR